MNSGEELNNQPKKQELIIQPSESANGTPNTSAHPATNRPKINPNEIYPDASLEVPDITNNMTAEQSFGVALSESQAKESNKYIFQRVKAVLVIGSILILSSLTVIFLSFGRENTILTVSLSFVEIAIASTLLLSKNKHTVLLILKIYLVLQLVGLFSSLIYPIYFVVNAVIVLMLFYAYSRVKDLSY